MITFIRRVFRAFFLDEQAFVRWMRGLGVTFAVGGVGFADEIAKVLNAPGYVRAIKIAALVCGFLGVANAAGQKNESAEALAQKLGIQPPATP